MTNSCLTPIIHCSTRQDSPTQKCQQTQKESRKTNMSVKLWEPVWSNVVYGPLQWTVQWSVSVKRSSPFTTGCINTPEPIQTGLSLQNTYISTWTEYDAVYKEIQTALPVAFVLMSRQRGINYLALTDPNIWTRLWDSNTFQNVRIIKIFKTLTQWEQLMRQERKVLLTHTYKRASLFSRLHKRAAMTLGDVWKKMERDYSQMEAVDSK